MWQPVHNLFSTSEHNLGASGSPGTLVTAGGTTDTKGSYTDLIASTAADAWMVSVMSSTVSILTANDRSYLIDIAIGTGPETIIIPDLVGGWVGNFGRWWNFPIFLPAGTQIRARCASVTASATVRVGVRLWGGPVGDPPWTCSMVEAIGEVAANSGGTTVTPGVGSDGSWTSLGTVSADTYGLLAGMGCAQDSTVSTATTTVDLGIGSSAEVAVVTSIMSKLGAGEEFAGLIPFHVPLYQPIPSGETIKARAIQNAAQNIDLAVYALQ